MILTFAGCIEAPTKCAKKHVSVHV